MSTNKSLKVLLVEDEKIALMVHKRMVEQLGYQLDVAEDGQKALALVSNGYDVILMDIGLPDMTGMEVTAKIRQREGGTHKAYIVGVTAYMLEEVEEQCLAAGMDGVIAKPMSAEKLAEILAAAAERKNRKS